MSRIVRLLGKQAFRMIDAEGNPLRDSEGKPLPRGVNRALFDAQALAFSWVTTPPDGENRRLILRSIAEVLERQDFQDAVRRATGDRARLHLRVRLMVEALETGGLQLNVPENLGF